MARHSFIQMSKLPNVKGRISYITSHAKQENLYATYRTADNTFWNNLARESQQEFLRSGTTGKGIEARELIIALPEIYTTFDPQQVLEEFTNKFRQQYGVECVSALHHNKRKTNYHIHLIFSERKLLPEPDIKIATRSVFYDETGKRVRTKKEITDENGQVRKGCTVIKKGEVYESHLFTTKDERFKTEAFIAEAKEVYTELINSHISDPEQRLKVFDKNSVYLPTKKIGKNNPKATEIEADNTARQEWNRTADLALVSGIEEASSAMIEGRIAGYAAAEHLGFLDSEEKKKRSEASEKALESLRQGMFAPKNRGKLIEKTEEGIPVSMNLLKKGFVSDDEIGQYPGVTHAVGIHPVMECTQNIPCNPCQDACPKGCISIGENITSLPVVVPGSQCIGCGMCVAACSGQAIFLVDEDTGDGFATVTLPYEFLPLPQKGDKGKGLDRSGKEVCEAEVVEVRSAKAFDHTNLLTMKVPKEMAMTARFFRAI